MVRYKPHDRGSYFVSVDNGPYYLVDLEEFSTEISSNGWCGCKDFQMRHLPLLQKEQESGIEHSTKRRCKHIIALIKELENLKNPSSLNKKEGSTSLAQETGAVNDEEAIGKSHTDGSLANDPSLTYKLTT